MFLNLTLSLQVSALILNLFLYSECVVVYGASCWDHEAAWQ